MSDDTPTITSVSGPETADMPEIDAPRPLEEYQDQDLSEWEHRTATLSYRGVDFLLAEPQTFGDAMALIDATDDPELFVRRSLDILVVRPDPLAPVLEEMGPWPAAVVAVEAISWANVHELIDEAASLETLRERGADVLEGE